MSTPTSNSKNRRDMDPRYHRVSLCDCHTGRFITSISKLEIEYIYDVMMKSAIEKGDWITNAIKENSLNVVNAIHDYMTVSDER